MVNGKTIKIGAKLRVSFLKQGVSSKGTKWQSFVYKDSKKNQETGNYDTIQSYNVFINNPQSNLKDGDYVTIKRINSLQASINFSNGVQYKNLTISCDIEEISEKNNEPNFDNANNNQQENSLDNPFAVDDYDFGF